MLFPGIHTPLVIQLLFLAISGLGAVKTSATNATSVAIPSGQSSNSNSSLHMGGHGAIKGEAWSPSGGWYFTPKNAKPNTIIVLGGLAVVGVVTAVIGNKLTVQANPDNEDAVIARWNAAAAKARKDSAISEAAGK